MVEWKVVKARKMIGSKTQLNVGDIVTQVEPENGIITVHTRHGEVGSLPANCLGKTEFHFTYLLQIDISLLARRGKLKVLTRHKLIGSKVWVEVGEEVTEVEPVEEGFVTVQKASGEEGSLPASCLKKRNHLIYFITRSQMLYAILHLCI